MGVRVCPVAIWEPSPYSCVHCVSPQQLSPAQQHKVTRVETCRLCPLNITGGYKPALAASWLHSVVWFMANCCFRRNTEMLPCAVLHVKAWSCHSTLTDKKIYKNIQKSKPIFRSFRVVLQGILQNLTLEKERTGRRDSEEQKLTCTDLCRIQSRDRQRWAVIDELQQTRSEEI